MTIITDEQVAYINNGGVIAYPTSTLPGLGCLPTKEGLDALFDLKSRSSDKPVSIGVASLDQVAHMVDIDPRIVEFVDAFPRGGLSVIYPAHQLLILGLVANPLPFVFLIIHQLVLLLWLLGLLQRRVRMKQVKNQQTQWLKQRLNWVFQMLQWLQEIVKQAPEAPSSKSSLNPMSHW